MKIQNHRNKNPKIIASGSKNNFKLFDLQPCSGIFKTDLLNLSDAGVTNGLITCLCLMCVFVAKFRHTPVPCIGLITNGYIKASRRLVQYQYIRSGSFLWIYKKSDPTEVS